MNSARTYTIHSLLFIVTFLTTTLAGVQWLNRNPFELANFASGLPYSIGLLAMLSAHEFGHYFAAKYHKMDTTLPYFIPIPPFLFNPFGTMGAVIRIKSPWYSRKALFDVGIAGPVAGFLVTIAILLYGLFTLPDIEYLYAIHPAYKITGIPADGFAFGPSILFVGIGKLFSSQGFVPPLNEVYHYPFLCVGWFGLFITALNLIPIGQLDGGHILYALVGTRNHRLIARGAFYIVLVLGIASLLPLAGVPFQYGSPGWLLWAGILFFVIKIDHPELPDPEPLSPGRRLAGWITLLIFILIFSPVPFTE